MTDHRIEFNYGEEPPTKEVRMQHVENGPNPWKIAVAAVVTIVVFIALILASSFGCSAYNRYQKRQNAHNEVAVTRTKIEKAEEEAKVNKAQIKATEAEAEKRVAESVGIKESQVEIDKTLTPLYVKHEYVQAIERGHIAVTLIPTGQDGLPIVANTPLEEQEAK